MKYQQVKKMLCKLGVVFVLTAALLTGTAGSPYIAVEKTAQAAAVSDKQSTQDTIVQNSTKDQDGQEAEYKKTENVYGKLSINGAVESLYVVNRFEVTKPGKIVDYGTYNRVENLTNLEAIVIDGDSNTVAAEKGNFYYQGDIEKGNLPWNIEVNYKLDGQEIEAKDLAGKNGKLEIYIKTSKNKLVNTTFYDNYLMQISLTLSNQTCTNIVSEKGTISDAGENKQITFTVMPGKEGNLALSSDVTDFVMKGISIAAVPFSMTVEFPDTSEMSDGLTELSDGIASLNDGTQKLNSGAGELQYGIVSLLGGMEEFHSGLKSYAKGIDSLNSGVQKVNSNIGELAAGAKSLADGSSSMAEGLGKLSTNGSSIITGSKGIQSGLEDASKMLTEAGINAADAANDPTIQGLYQAVQGGYLTDAQYKAIVAAVGTVGGVSKNYGAFQDGLELYVGGVSTVAGSYDKLNSGVSSLASGLSQFKTGFGDLAKGSDELAKGSVQITDGSEKLVKGTSKIASGFDEFQGGVEKLADGTDEMADSTADMPDEMQEQMDDMMNEYKYDFEPVSFVSDKNTNTDAVQFILTTEEIKVSSDKVKEEEEEPKTFIERIENLFSGFFEKISK